MNERGWVTVTRYRLVVEFNTSAEEEWRRFFDKNYSFTRYELPASRVTMAIYNLREVKLEKDVVTIPELLKAEVVRE